MQAMIRLRRVGRRHQASFRIVVAQKSEAADGVYLESLGTYNPRTQPSLIRLDAARTLHWLHEGVQPSDTVRSILRRTGVWEKFHEGAGPDDLAPDEKTVLQGPEGMDETTSRRAAQAKAAREEPEPEAEAAEAEAPEAEAPAEEAPDAGAAPEVEEEPEAEGEDEPEAEEEPEAEDEPEAEATEADAPEAEAEEEPEAETEEAPEAEAAVEEEPEEEEAEEEEETDEEEDEEKA